MHKRMLGILACPECGGRLEARGEWQGDRLQTGELTCPQGRCFPVLGGIPRFVPHDDYAASFSLQWTIHRATQLDGDIPGESEATFWQKTRFGRADLAGKLVLDAGCGMGRFAQVAARHLAEVVGIDLSLAVESAAANLEKEPRAHWAQADLTRPPFAPGTFDLIYSIGVLHHTPDTRAAFMSLVPLLRPGGRISIWVYSAYPQIVNLTSRFWRRLTTRLPKRLLYALCQAAGPMYYIHRIPWLGKAFIHLVPMSSHPRWQWRVLDTFDWYSPRYQWKHRYPEVVGWFREAGLEQVEIAEPEITVTGVRPGGSP